MRDIVTLPRVEYELAPPGTMLIGSIHMLTERARGNGDTALDALDAGLGRSADCRGAAVYPDGLPPGTNSDRLTR
ncbi:hypothetical protein ACQEVS_28600 [Streptomyces sp. CA-181903]|uniref:hypothetical protein n=1 Tax=Streptomyces sp. CA-181903 TaxID=3240055 RepID=UPI003D8B63AF